VTSVDPAQWSARLAAVFDRASSTYDHVGVPWFTPIAEGLIGEINPRPGERGLDIGCGRGAALFPLAEAVGPAGSATGIDLAPGMVEAARVDAANHGLTNVELHVMDASSPQLPEASYDLAVSSCVIFFLPEPAEALRAWRRLLKPGGRLGISTFGRRDPRWERMDEVFHPYLPEGLRQARSGRGGQFATDAGVAELIEKADFSGVRTVTRDVEVVFTSPEQWHEWSWSHGQRVYWELVPAAERDTVRATAFERVEEARGPDGRITLSQQVRYTLAERPPD
jgi:ubiquinone/menaquinone biosynthesis C-methylase UbiE